MSDRLLPCPFCGGTPHIVKSYDSDSEGTFFSYRCAKCGAGTREKYAMETCSIFYAELRDIWNQRFPK